MLPVKKCLLTILGVGVFLSLIAFLIYMSNYKKSVNIFDDRQEFIVKRKTSLSILQCVVYISVVSFELCLLVFILGMFFGH